MARGVRRPPRGGRGPSACRRQGCGRDRLREPGTLRSPRKDAPVRGPHSRGPALPKVVFAAGDPGAESGGGSVTLERGGIEVVGPVWDLDRSRAENPAFFHASERRSPWVSVEAGAEPGWEDRVQRRAANADHRAREAQRWDARASGGVRRASRGFADRESGRSSLERARGCARQDCSPRASFSTRKRVCLPRRPCCLPNLAAPSSS